MLIDIHLFIAVIDLIHGSLDVLFLTLDEVWFTFFFAGSATDFVEPVGL